MGFVLADLTSEGLIALMYETNSVKFGKFKLSSGKESNVYIDLRNALSYVKLREIIVRMMMHVVKTLDYDIVVGVATGGLPWASLLAYEERKPLSYVRESKKEHGTEHLIEGRVNNMKCLIIDDVATTGRSLLNAVSVVRNHGGSVLYALVIVDRNEGAKKVLLDANVELKSVLSLDDILSFGLKRGFVVK
ncbi:MAG: orotate phosphoribosyltransferase [Thermoprotei archaeon]